MNPNMTIQMAITHKGRMQRNSKGEKRTTKAKGKQKWQKVPTINNYFFNVNTQSS